MHFGVTRNLKTYLLVLCLLVSGVDAAPPQVTRLVLSPGDPNRFQTHPRIALNTNTRQSLVVWEKHPGDHPAHSLQARLLNSTGKPVGPVFTVVSGPNTYNPDLVYNPRRNEFALVYANELSSASATFAVFLQRLSLQGRPIGAAIRISAPEDSARRVNNENPSAIYDETTGNTTLLWVRNKISDSTADILEGLYGVVLSPSYAVLSGPVLIRKSSRDQGVYLIQPYVTDLGIHPWNGRFLLAFYQASPGSFGGIPRFEYYAASLDPGLSGIQTSDFLKVKTGVNPEGAIYTGFAFSPGGTGFVIYAENAGLRLRKLNPAGKFAGPAVPAFRAPLHQTRFSSVAVVESRSAAGSRWVLFGIQDPGNETGNRGLWMQALDENGMPAGAPLKLELNDYSSLLAASTVPVSPTSRSSRLALVFEEGREVLRPVNGESTQLILLNVNLSLP